MSFKVLHLCYHERGGAGRSALRLNNALRSLNIHSDLWVQHLSDEPNEFVFCRKNKLAILSKAFRELFKKLYRFVFKSNNKIAHSPALLRSTWPEFINNSDFDVVNLHWIGGEMISIKDLSRINKPIVWTVHDMWPFCGAEHVSYDHRWIEGYKLSNRNAEEKLLDINLITWLRKKIYWRNIQFTFVCPSTWMEKNIRQSKLFHNHAVKHIPNCLDLEFWHEKSKRDSRKGLDLTEEKILGLFIMSGDVGSYHKGFDILIECLINNNNKLNNFELIVVGKPNSIFKDINLPIKYIGSLKDDISLRLIYSAIDFVVIPSRIDNLPNTGVEALACSRPVVGFDIGGMRDIVSHLVNGYLVDRIDSDSLFKGIYWAINHSNDHQIMKNCRDYAETSFSPKNIAQMYLDLYKKFLN